MNQSVTKCQCSKGAQASGPTLYFTDVENEFDGREVTYLMRQVS